MTRKNYVAVASKLASIADSFQKTEIVDALCGVFQNDNPRFDCDKFIDACEYLPQASTSNDTCKGCGDALPENTAMCALSRYAHGYICSACGTREALQGDFIK